MKINHLLKRLNTIDEMLRNRTKVTSKMIGTFEMKWTEQVYSSETIRNITDEKSSIINRLDKEGFISSEEIGKYYLSEDYTFTPKISYENVNLTKMTENNKKEGVLLISVKVMRLNIIGIETRHDTEIFPFNSLKIKIDFLGEVDAILEVGCTYTDGINTFIAITKNEIILGSNFVDTFEIPKEIICIHKLSYKTS